MSFLDEFEQSLTDASTGNGAQRRSKIAELSAALDRELDRAVSKGDAAQMQTISNAVDRLVAAKSAADEQSDRVGMLRGAGDALETGVKALHPMNAGFKAPTIANTPIETWKAVYDAAVSGRSLRVELGVKSPFAVGSLSPELPSLLQTQLTQILPYEPDNLFDHFVAAPMTGPSIQYLVHTGNANPAAAVAELGTKPDLGMELESKVATPTKIAALASLSMESIQDFHSGDSGFQYFLSFFPSELMRAVVDATTNEIVNGSGTGIHQLGLVNVPGTLTRVYPAGAGGSTLTPLDCLELAVNDLRVGPAFCEADLLAMSPGTFSMFRRQKDSLGRYLLQDSPAGARANSIWNIPVIQNTWIPEGTVIVADHSVIMGWTRMGLTLEQNLWGDAEWTTNAVSFRCEHRIAIGVLRPSAVNIVTGFTGDTSATTE